MSESIDERFATMRRAAKCPMYLKTDDGRVIRVVEWTATTLAEQCRVKIQVVGWIELDENLPETVIKPTESDRRTA